MRLVNCCILSPELLPLFCLAGRARLDKNGDQWATKTIWDGEGAGEDSYEENVREKLIELFERNQKKVFFSRQLKVKLEDMSVAFTES